MLLKKVIKDLFTGPDDNTYELAHFLWVFGVLAFVGMVAYTVYKTGGYPQGFGTDFGTLNAGGAAGAFARAKADQTVAPKGDADANNPGS